MHNEVKHNLHNVGLIFWPYSPNIPIFVLYVKTVPIIEAYFDRYVLSKVGIVCYFVYIVICVCVFVTLLAGGNKEIYLSIYLFVFYNLRPKFNIAHYITGILENKAPDPRCQDSHSLSGSWSRQRG